MADPGHPRIAEADANSLTATVATALTASDTIAATCPGFSGLGVASVNAISGLSNPGNVVAASTSSGSNPAVGQQQLGSVAMGL